MTRQKTNVKYDTIKIPEGLTEQIDRVILLSKGNFTSRTDVVKQAVRDLIRNLDDMEKWREERDRRKKEISAARVDGRASSAGGEGLAGNKDSSEGRDTQGKADDRDKQPNPDNSGAGTQDNMGQASS